MQDSQPVRFSVLLPTRNGGPHLHGCLTTVLRADTDSFEVVVSDNANDDATQEVLESFRQDPRVRIVRQDRLLTVTDNWNAAYDVSCGEYVLMLGDDDALLPSYFETLEGLLDRWHDPDCVTHNGFSFVGPNAITGLEVAHYADPHFRFGPGFEDERELSAPERKSIVRDMFRFRVRVPLNMQTTLVARSALERLPGLPFQPPFPDHYALNGLLLIAERWVFAPVQPLVVGVSPKSFGHHVYSEHQAEGLQYLGIDTSFPGRLPGNELLNGMYLWLQLVQRTFSEHLRGVEISWGDYVARQMYTWMRQTQAGHLKPAQLLRRLRCLGSRDWLALSRVLVDWENAQRLGSAMREKTRSGRIWHGLRPLPAVRDIDSFVTSIDQDATAPMIVQSPSST